MNDSPAIAGAVTIHMVQAGDSLAKLAEKYLGNAARYSEIATRNGLAPEAIPFIGQKLIIPAANVTVAPDSPGGSVPVDYGGNIIETVTTVAKRIPPFWKDWRFWLAVGGAAGLLWFLSSQKRRR